MDKTSDRPEDNLNFTSEPPTVRETPHSKRALARPSGQYAFDIPKNNIPSLASLDPNLAEGQNSEISTEQEFTLEIPPSKLSPEQAISAAVRKAISPAMLEQMALKGGYDSLRPRPEEPQLTQNDNLSPTNIPQDGK